MLPQIQLKGLIHERTHFAAIVRMNTGIVFCILDHLEIADHIIDGQHPIDTHLEVIARL
jgi:hypothetical protein